MKTHFQFVALILTCVLCISACSNRTPKIVHEGTSERVETEKQEDSMLVSAAGLPVNIDSTDYLIHPIGQYRVLYGRSSKFGFESGSKRGYTNFTIANSNKNGITGDIHNLKFQHIDSEELTVLTDEVLEIKSVSFLRDIYETTKKQFLLYRVVDRDTNKDGKLNLLDVESLYLSSIDGSGFQKITSDFHEVLDWNIIKRKRRLYFRSMEDSNRNGEFDIEDRVHYKFIDFSGQQPQIKSYQPL